MEPKHTPLPWFNETECLIPRIYGPGHCPVASSNIPIKEIDEANAEFIVRACNAHYELVEALEQAMGWAAGYPLKGPGNSADRIVAEQVYRQAEAALKKAKGTEARWNISE